MNVKVQPKITDCNNKEATLFEESNNVKARLGLIHLNHGMHLTPF